jgi:hypothetical protein
MKMLMAYCDEKNMSNKDLYIEMKKKANLT